MQQKKKVNWKEKKNNLKKKINFAWGEKGGKIFKGEEYKSKIAGNKRVDAVRERPPSNLLIFVMVLGWDASEVMYYNYYQCIIHSHRRTTPPLCLSHGQKGMRVAKP